MFQVYSSAMFTSSELLDTDTFVKEKLTLNLLPEEPYRNEKIDDKSREIEIQNLMGSTLNDSEFETIVAECSVNNLMKNKNTNIHLRDTSMCNSARINYKALDITADALKLKTVDSLQRRMRDITDERYSLTLKYKGNLCPGDYLKPQDGPPDLKPGHEILYNIRIYHPFKHISGKSCDSNPKFHQELIFLGSQTLDILRDKIICPNDLGLRYEMSENPDSDVKICSKDMFKSGFLYIEDTFYNDFRNPDNLDYSETIKKWARTRTGLGPFGTGIMENTRFNELKVRLGYPQIYQHQGNCEHLFVFSDIEILQPSDCCYMSCYPLFRSTSLKKARRCMCCGKFMTKWLVKESTRVPFDPAFFCDNCFRSYNYINGKKVGKFKAYPYYDRMNAV